MENSEKVDLPSLIHGIKREERKIKEIQGVKNISSEDVYGYYLCSTRWNSVWVQTEDLFLEKISGIFGEEKGLNFDQKNQILEYARCFTHRMELLSLAKRQDIYHEDEIYVNFRQKLNLN